MIIALKIRWEGIGKRGNYVGGGLNETNYILLFYATVLNQKTLPSPRTL